MVILDSMAFISGFNNAPVLLAVLNSDLLFFWMKLNVHEYGSSGFRLSNQYVELMPVIKDVSQRIEEEVTNLLTSNKRRVQMKSNHNPYMPLRQTCSS